MSESARTNPPEAGGVGGAGAATSATVRALLECVIDYAGLFPPAALEMEPAVEHYARYCETPDAWMLGRMIVPISRLAEFETAAGARGPIADGWRISGLTSADELEKDIDRIAGFNERHEDKVIDVIELKAQTPAAIDAALDAVPDELYPFFEIPIADDPRGLVAAIAGSDAGAKVRTGGPTADLYPTAAHLARFVAACAAADVPFKATAGLHHALRHQSEALGVREFGFLNLFVAAALARHRGLSFDALVPVLEATSAADFRFGNDELSWHGERLRLDQIEATRANFAISFGSCSFDEPREELRRLKLL